MVDLKDEEWLRAVEWVEKSRQVDGHWIAEHGVSVFKLKYCLGFSLYVG